MTFTFFVHLSDSPSWFSLQKSPLLDEYAAYFDYIDPISQYKTWTTEQVFNRHSKDLVPRYNVFSDSIKAAFVVSNPIDLGAGIFRYFLQFYIELLHYGPNECFFKPELVVSVIMLALDSQEIVQRSLFTK